MAPREIQLKEANLFVTTLDTITAFFNTLRAIFYYMIHCGPISHGSISCNPELTIRELGPPERHASMSESTAQYPYTRFAKLALAGLHRDDVLIN